MLKQLVEWDGFDGRRTTRTCYFNLTRYEIAHDMELELLEERFKRFQEDVIGDDERSMTPPEIRELLDIFKTIIKHAYGIRSQDGKRFIKNEEVWNEFVETGAFDAFIWYMFEDASRANAFMNGIWPKEIQEAAQKVRNERPDLRPVEDVDVRDSMDLTVDDGIPSISSLDETSEDAPNGWHFLNFTKDELLNMGNEDWGKVKKASTDGRNVPLPVLQIDGLRRSGSQTE